MTVDAQTRQAIEGRSGDESRIRAVLEGVNQALKERDAGTYLAHFVPDAAVFDLAPPLVHGIDRERLEAWLATWKGPIERSSRDLVISIDGDLAVAHGLYHVSATTGAGHSAAWWMRATICLRRDGNWRIVHEHTSVPFHMDGSFRAAIDLQPA